ncbi:MAG: hypothetical protein LBU87_03515 [Lactobacillales bacterium]|nr:hypothetical protein [Lactobacillales bacterium]
MTTTLEQKQKILNLAIDKTNKEMGTRFNYKEMPADVGYEIYDKNRPNLKISLSWEMNVISIHGIDRGSIGDTRTLLKNLWKRKDLSKSEKIKPVDLLKLGFEKTQNGFDDLIIDQPYTNGSPEKDYHMNFSYAIKQTPNNEKYSHSISTDYPFGPNVGKKDSVYITLEQDRKQSIRIAVKPFLKQIDVDRPLTTPETITMGRKLVTELYKQFSMQHWLKGSCLSAFGGGNNFAKMGLSDTSIKNLGYVQSKNGWHDTLSNITLQNNNRNTR